MNLLILAVSCLAAGALLSALLAGRPSASRTASVACLTAGCLIGLAAAFAVLASGAAPAVSLPWSVPLGKILLEIDPLSAFFLVPIFAVGLAAGVYGEGYLAACTGHLSAPAARFFHFLLTASMATVVCARNAVLFLAAWEVMALSSFFLVCAEDRKHEARRGGLLFLLCTHAGTLCLLVFFAALGSRAGSMDFSAIKAAMPAPGPALTGLFALALAGFGMKAGFIPFHFWLPEAHPVAPSHASAVLSAVVIKMGIYGLLRFLSFCPVVPESWGFLLLALGAASAVLGVLFALVQHDLKRLLAYSSIENVGIVVMGTGLGCLGLARGNAALAAVGFAAALLHVLNHSLFKSLLFLGAGAYAQALGGLAIEGAGGLLRRMPRTSLLAWTAAAAACGLPPLNGFVGEWLLYRGLLGGGPAETARGAVLAAASLALVGGLAAACLTMACGAMTLGEPRGDAARNARDPGNLMLWPMSVLGAACLALGLVPVPFARAAARAAATVGRFAPAEAASAVESLVAPLALVGALGAGMMLLAGLLWALRRRLLRNRSVEVRPTWGCGFDRPSAAMQYTASSYAQPLTRVFAALLGTATESQAPSGYWPRRADFRSRTTDPLLDRALLPASAVFARSLAVVRRVQHGHLQFYLLHALVFLILVLVWKL